MQHWNEAKHHKVAFEILVFHRVVLSVVVFDGRW